MIWACLWLYGWGALITGVLGLELEHEKCGPFHPASVAASALLWPLVVPVLLAFAIHASWRRA